MFKKTAFFILLITALIAPLCSAEDDKTSDVIKIGVVYNITGAQSALDLPSWRGAQIAAKEINAGGGLLGKRLELCFYDAGTNLVTAEKATAQLTMTDKVSAIIGFSDSDFALRAGVWAQTAKIPFITSGATDAGLTQKIGDYFFMTAFSDRGQASAAAAFIAKDLGFKTAYILKDIKMEYTMTLSAAFRKEFEKYNGKDAVLLEDTFESNAHDFGKQIARLLQLQQKPEMLYIAAGPQDIGNILQALRTAGINNIVMGGDSYDNTDFKRSALPYIGDGVYYTTHASLNDAKAVLDSASREFVSEYMAEFDAERPEAFAALGFDAVMLVADAIKRCGTDNPKNIRDALAKTENFRGISGVISYDGRRHVPKKTVYVMQLKGNKAILADVWRPDEQ